MKIRDILPAVLAAVLACSCVGDDPSAGFQEDDTLRIDIKGYTTFSYDPLSCQKSFNRDNCEFRVHSDNMSDFYSVVLEAFPAEVGQMVNGTASWTTSNNLHTKKTTFEVLKLEGDKVWLWSSRNRIAMVVQILD